MSSIGLLQKANLLSKKQGLAFCDFALENNIHFFAKFSLRGNFFYISNSYGLDFASILSSKSTVDFWNGIAPVKNRFYNFSKEENNIIPLYQFFSFKLKDFINSIQILRETNSIFMICNSQLSDDKITELVSLTDNYKSPVIDINNISQEIVLSKFEISIDSVIKNYLSEKNKDSTTITLFTESLRLSLANQLYFNFIKNGYFSFNQNGNIKVIFKTKNPINPQLIKKHIQVTLSKFADSSSSFIEIYSKGISESASDFLDFFKAE